MRPPVSESATPQGSPSGRTPRPLPNVPASGTATPVPSRVPAIHLQESTPDQGGLSLAPPVPPPTSLSPNLNSSNPHDSPNAGWESAPPSPSPNSAATFDSPTSNTGAPVLPIHIPQTGDAAMQQFFHDIVGQLTTISLRNSLTAPGGASSSTTASSPATTFRSSFMDSGSSTAATTPAMDHGDMTQFEDAEDDESDVGTTSFSPGGGGAGEYDMYRAGTPASSTGSYRAGSPVLSTGGSSMHRRSADVTFGTPTPSGPPLVRPRINMRASSRVEATNSPARPTTRQANSWAGTSSSDKENMRMPPPGQGGNAGLGLQYPNARAGAPPLAPRPGQSGHGRQTLGLAIQGGGQASGWNDYEFVERPSMDEQMQMDKAKIKKKKRECFSHYLQSLVILGY